MAPEIIAVIKPIVLYLLKLIIAEESGETVSEKDLQDAFVPVGLLQPILLVLCLFS